MEFLGAPAISPKTDSGDPNLYCCTARTWCIPPIAEYETRGPRNYDLGHNRSNVL